MSKAGTVADTSLDERWKNAEQTVEVKVALGNELTNEKAVEELNRRVSEFWDQGGLSDERQALVLAVRDILLQLAQDPDSWLPTASHINNGNLEINMSIKSDDIDMKSFELRNRAETHMASLRTEMENMVKELGDAEG